MKEGIFKESTWFLRLLCQVVAEEYLVFVIPRFCILLFEETFCRSSHWSAFLPNFKLHSAKSNFCNSLSSCVFITVILKTPQWVCTLRTSVIHLMKFTTLKIQLCHMWMEMFFLFHFGSTNVNLQFAISQIVLCAFCMEFYYKTFRVT